MKTIAQLIAGFALAFSSLAPLPAADRPTANVVPMLPEGALAVTRADFAKRMATRILIAEPSWTIHTDREKDGIADVDAKQKEHKRFMRWVRENLSEGDKGEDENPKVLSITPLEFLMLYGKGAAAKERAMANWSSRPGAPDNYIARHLENVTEAIAARGDKAKPEDREFLALAIPALKALQEARVGKASDGQRAAIKALVLSLE